jgi:hypothetical protein
LDLVDGGEALGGVEPEEWCGFLSARLQPGESEAVTCAEFLQHVNQDQRVR